ncbi:tRNA (cytidine(34)-2'-O)-methyltransferase, partial [Staphylococcus pseudintermedius]
DNIESFFEQTEGQYFLLTKFGSKNHTSQDFSDVDQNYYFIFGKETTGLPDWVKDKYDNTALRIPMNENVRALNLSNTAAILVYEALRQQNYPNLQ